jgi:hypothetical protein
LYPTRSDVRARDALVTEVLRVSPGMNVVCGLRW